MFSLSDTFFNICAFVLRSSNGFPQHVAIIPDNNRTYSKKNNLSLIATYLKGQKKLFEQLRFLVYLKISHVTVYLLSSHNLKRNDYEKKCVLDALYIFIHTLMIEPNNCRFKIIGDVSHLPNEFQELCFLLVDQTKYNTGTVVNLAINYSGREELIDISMKIASKVRNDNSSAADITENLFSNLIYAKNSMNVDLLIRTSKDKRLSEFLLWQNIRSYLHYIDICWPEITGWHLLGVLFIYQHCERRKINN